MPQLLQQPNRLHPTKNLFHAFPHALADFVASVPRRAPVDRAATRPLVVPRHVRCHILPTQRLHQFLLVVAFVSAQRHAPLAAHFFRHLPRPPHLPPPPHDTSPPQHNLPPPPPPPPPKKTPPRHIAFQQTLAVLAEYRGHPHRLIHVQPHKPAEQQVVIKLLHQQPLAAHRVQHLQQQGPQQLLRRDRRPPVRRVESRKFRRQLLQHGIHDLANRPQRMFLRHSLLRRNVAVHRSLLLIFSAHAILLKSLRRARARFRVTPCRTFSATC